MDTMWKKTISFLLVTFLCYAITFVMPLDTTSYGATVITVDDSGGANYTSIQAAIDSASTGDTINVYAGTYTENILIDKQLTITGVNGKSSTVINPAGDGHVVEITADEVMFSGFTVQNARGTGYKCIKLQDADQCSVSECTVQASDDSDGITLFSSDGNIITDNTVKNNYAYGLRLYASNSNNIVSNTIQSNQRGISIDEASSGNTVADNTITLSNQYGIYLDTAVVSNSITGNILTANSRGINSQASGNTIYHNTFNDNTEYNAYDSGSNNWDNGYPSGGNSWSDYTGEDADDDNIGDSPYNIPGGSNKDNYPLGVFVEENQKPIAMILTITPNPATAGDEVTFVGSGSDDGVITEREWTSNKDGKLSASDEFSRSTLSVGTHIISFRVKDDEGQWSTADTESLTINAVPSNEQPVAYITSVTPNPATVGQTISFNGRGEDEDGHIIGYLWAEGGTTLSTAPSFQKSDFSVGTHVITFKVKDNDNMWSEEVSRTLTVNPGSSQNTPPTANPNGPYEERINTSLRFDGSRSYVSEGTITNYTWDFGDGNTGYGEFVYHMYNSAGNYTVSLTVRDQHGDSNVAFTYAEITSPTVEENDNQTPGFESILLLIILIGMCIFQKWNQEKL